MSSKIPQTPPYDDYVSIIHLIHLLSTSQDSLDWALYVSLWTSTVPLSIDLSQHLSSYSADMRISAVDIAKRAHAHLSGFDGTQHALSNVVVDVESERTATANAYITAYHEYKRPAEEGPSMAIMRGKWEVKLAREDKVWKAIGIKVSRLVGIEGDEDLYRLAWDKAEQGNGRQMLTSWE